VRQLRESKGLSQADVERKSGLSRSYVSGIEGGHTQPSLGTLEKLAKAFEVKVPELLFAEGNGAKKSKKFGPTRITTPFPLSAEIARAFKLSPKRVHRISRLVKSVLGNREVQQAG
jgi:transcriptional regulator with XRE-family HTH domain